MQQSYWNSFNQGTEKHLAFRGLEDLVSFKYALDRLLLRELHEAGISLLLATDASGLEGLVPGYSVHDELRILTENGLTPYEAIATGTVNAAQVVEKMNGEGDFGTIEIGGPKTATRPLPTAYRNVLRLETDHRGSAPPPSPGGPGR